MHRRHLLASLPATAVGLAGCLDAGFEGVGGDGPPGDDARVVWAREDHDHGVAFEKTVRSASLPDATATVSLHNRTAAEFWGNHGCWRVFTYAEDDWHLVRAATCSASIVRYPPGDRHEWTFEFTSDPVDPRRDDAHLGDGGVVAGLGGGVYAVRVDGELQGDDTGAEGRTAYLARLDLDGPAATLRPSPLVVSSERDGDIVHVEAVGRTTTAGEATYVLRRTPDVDGPTRLLTEQAAQRWPLADALAHAAPGVREVRLRAPTRRGPPFGVDPDDPPVYQHDGETWTATVERASG
jgi:hypothetical protein